MDSAQSTTLIVNYLPQNMDDRALYSMFVTIGAIGNCRVMKDFKTGYSYGFGFVSYISPDSAKKAIEKLNGIEIMSKRIKVTYARPSNESIKNTNLYITNLPRHFTSDDVTRIFEKFGTIIQVNLLKDKYTGLPRGVCFVRFNQTEEAKAAIKELDGVELEAGEGCLSVRVAEEHGKQKAAYYAGFHSGLHHQQPRNKTLNVNGSNVHPYGAPVYGVYAQVRGVGRRGRGTRARACGVGGPVRGVRVPHYNSYVPNAFCGRGSHEDWGQLNSYSARGLGRGPLAQNNARVGSFIS